MNSKLAVFGIVIASLLLGEQAQAQTRGNSLRGINQIDLVIPALNKSSEECQITEALIRDAFMYTASGARFSLIRDSQFQFFVPFFYFNTMTLSFKPDQLCVSAIEMRLRVTQQVELKASGQSILARIELWNDGSIRSSAKGQHGDVIRDWIERATKRFITDWNLDNK